MPGLPNAELGTLANIESISAEDILDCCGALVADDMLIKKKLLIREQNL